MKTNYDIHNQQQCEHTKVAAVVHQIERCINDVISSEDTRVGGNWKFASDHKMYLEQVNIWFALLLCNSSKGKESKRFPVFLREQHKVDESKIIEYTRETWKQLTVVVQSLGNDSMLCAFDSLYEFFDIEEEFTRDYE